MLITKGKYILILGKRSTQGLGEHSLTAEKVHSVKFTETRKKFYLSLHCNGANSYFFINDTKIIIFKAKDSEMVVTPLCLGNISKDWPVDNMKIETRFNDYVYNFSVDYDAIAVEDVLDVHKNLMKKSVCRKTVFCRTNNFINFSWCKFLEMYLND